MDGVGSACSLRGTPFAPDRACVRCWSASRAPAVRGLLDVSSRSPGPLVGFVMMNEQDGERWFFLDAAERELVRRAQAAVSVASGKQGAVIEGMLARLGSLAELIRDSPSLASSWGGDAARAFSADTLIEHLCRVRDYDLDLHIPTKAVVGQAYVIAKINFMRAIGYMLAAVNAPAPLRESVQHEVAQSIYTKLAEELFVSIVTDPSALQQVKTGAARFLFRIWEERLHIEVDDFAPLLESAWKARSKLLPVLGTMLGSVEVFQLFREARDQRFLDYFSEDHVEPEQLLAFEEFLFDLSHEEIARLRAHMTEGGRATISLDEARAVLGNAGTPGVREQSAAAALYTSYKKRRVNAAHRVLTGASGPKKTAEEYVMIAFLGAGAPVPA
jgi:hypothetical protein